MTTLQLVQLEDRLHEIEPVPQAALDLLVEAIKRLILDSEIDRVCESLQRLRLHQR